MTGTNKIDSAIVASVLPECYKLINELVDEIGPGHKDLIIKCRRLLPPVYKNSFSFTKKEPHV